MVKLARLTALISEDGRFTLGIVSAMELPAANSLTTVSSIETFRVMDSHVPIEVTPARSPEKVGVKLEA